MATFKVGDRVRFVGRGVQVPSGIEGVIVRPRGYVCTSAEARTDRYGVLLFGYPPPSHEPWGIRESSLAPLTPPAADTWAESKVREVTKPQYIEPVKTKEKV